jgi:hypothetical protein
MMTIVLFDFAYDGFELIMSGEGINDPEEDNRECE